MQQSLRAMSGSCWCLCWSNKCFACFIWSLFLFPLWVGENTSPPHAVVPCSNVSSRGYKSSFLFACPHSVAQRRGRSSSLWDWVTQNTAFHAANGLELRDPVGRILHQLNLSSSSIFLYVSSFSPWHWGKAVPASCGIGSPHKAVHWEIP